MSSSFRPSADLGSSSPAGRHPAIRPGRDSDADGFIDEVQIQVPGLTERVVRGSYVVLRLVDAVHLAEIDQIRLLPRSTALGAAATLNDRRLVELESLALSQAFLLEAGRETSEVALRKLFTPALISNSAAAR